MGMFDNETITDEFFTSDTEQVEEISAESESEEVEEDEELESNEEVVDEEESSETEQDESPLIAGKFKNQEDLVNAYKNLEKEFTKARQNKQQPETQQQTQQTQLSQDDFNEQFFTTFNQDPIGVLSHLVQNAVSQVTQPLKEKEQYETLGKDIDKLAKSYKQIQSEEGMTSLFNKAKEIAAEFGNENLARSSRILNMAAQEVFGDSKADVYKQAKKDAVKEAEEVRQTKQGLSTISSSKKPAEKAKTAEDEITDAIMSFNKKSIFSGR